jgi:formylglycine-generating enzyme required for sulfatase activity
MSSRTWFHLLLLAGLLVVLGFAVPGRTKAPAPMLSMKMLTNSIGMKLVLIPAGKFTIGSTEAERKDVLALIKQKKMPDWLKAEGPQHQVEISKAFYLGACEVTQKQFKDVMGYNPSYFSSSGKAKEGIGYLFWKPGGGKDKVKGLDTDDFPVENVSWEEASTFLDKLSALPEEKKNGRQYRLPTEAEWEYACRGGASAYQTFHYGNSLSSSQANFDGNYPFGGADKGKCPQRTCKVGSFVPNPWGLHDMHGNVWEWCSDRYAEDYYSRSPRRDPAGPSQGSDRVRRGGSWFNSGGDCRSANHIRSAPGDRSYSIGFRAALNRRPQQNQ